jgi:predicted metal-dependent hydrolase
MIRLVHASIEDLLPTSATGDEIAGVLHRRREWLLDQTQHMASRAAMTPTVAHFVTGAKVPFRGRLVRLRVEPSDKALVEVSFRNGFLVLRPRTVPEASRDPSIESALRLWPRKRLREDVAAFVRQHGEPNGLKPTWVEIKNQKHLWETVGEIGSST